MKLKLTIVDILEIVLMSIVAVMLVIAIKVVMFDFKNDKEWQKAYCEKVRQELQKQ